MNHSNALPLAQLKRLTVPLLGLSAISNLAVLVSPIFMMQVLDRVIPTGNLQTLTLLLGVAAAALFLQALVDGLRDLCFAHAARWSEQVCLPSVLQTSAQHRQGFIAQLAQLKSALSGNTAVAALSAPWLPLFLFVLWIIHPWFVALASGLILFACLTRVSIQSLRAGYDRQLDALRQQETTAQRDMEALAASPGLNALGKNLLLRVIDAMERRGETEARITPIAVKGTAALAFLRSLTQLSGLSLGAALVVADALSPGGMIAASLILTKTVTSFEMVLSAFADIKTAHRAFKALLDLPEAGQQDGTEIGTLSGALRCEGLIFPRASGAPPRLERISFALPPAACLVIVGPSGSGKTTLLEALSGVAPCPVGTVWLEETEVKTLTLQSQLSQIGYLPQRAELYHGSLAENIAGFAPNAIDEDVLAAAKMAGVHGLISALPASYDTDIGAAPHLLSAGQKQRVALARAIFHQPRYLFLDEPNALLDAAGERQLCAVLARLKENGTTIVMVIHRSGLMGLADHVLALENGRMTDFGARSEVLGRMSSGRRRIELPLRHESLQDLNDWVGAQFTRSSDAELAQRASLVATELFNLTRASGPQDSPRKASFLFRFLSDQSCEIKVTEDSQTKAEAKLRKVAEHIKDPHTQVADLPSDEAAIAVLSQISDAFDVQNIEGQAVYRAAVSMRAIDLQRMSKH